MIVCDGGGGGRVALVIWVVDVCANIQSTNTHIVVFET